MLQLGTADLSGAAVILPYNVVISRSAPNLRYMSVHYRDLGY